jgi:hypothetical protein
MIFPFQIHLLSSPGWFFQRNFKELGPSLVPVGECETVHAPKLRRRINFRWFDESAANLKSVSATDTNHFVRPTWFSAAKPSLLVNRSVAFASDLSIIETVTPKFFAQWLIGMAFFSTSLSRSRHFVSRWRSQVADRRPTAFCCLRPVHRPTSRISNFRNAAITEGKWNLTHLAESFRKGILFDFVQLSTVRGETLIARASCGRFKSARSSPTDNGTSTFGTRAAWRVLLVVFCVVMVVPFYL